MTQHNPLTQLFETQRTAVKQSKTLTHDTIEAQKAWITAVSDGADASSELLEQNADLTKGTIHTALDTMEASLPGDSVDIDDLREVVDEGFDSATEAQQESLTALVEAIEESGTVFDEFADQYTDAVDDSFDSFLEAHERTETTFNSVTDRVDETNSELDPTA